MSEPDIFEIFKNSRYDLYEGTQKVAEESVARIPDLVDFIDLQAYFGRTVRYVLPDSNDRVWPPI